MKRDVIPMERHIVAEVVAGILCAFIGVCLFAAKPDQYYRASETAYLWFFGSVAFLAAAAFFGYAVHDGRLRRAAQIHEEARRMLAEGEWDDED